jgi:hypothetical protein
MSVTGKQLCTTLFAENLISIPHLDNSNCVLDLASVEHLYPVVQRLYLKLLSRVWIVAMQ